MLEASLPLLEPQGSITSWRVYGGSPLEFHAPPVGGAAEAVCGLEGVADHE